MNWQLTLGAQLEETGVCFRVWAEDVKQMEVVLFDEQQQEIAAYPLTKDHNNYFSGFVEGLKAGALYMYRLDGEKLRPDPASRFQPSDIHGISQVVAPDFEWHDDQWHGIAQEDLIIYEVHIGTATPEGTFAAFIEKLDYVKSLGVTAIELMPVADFPGNRNWGYDGVDQFAPAHAYGTPADLKRLIDVAHAHGLAVLLDVVYNHFGPDGNYLREFSHDYFTHAKKSPWGDALNFANRAVRDFFIANAQYWAHEYHFDGLRLDATPWIQDDSEYHILKELVSQVRASLPADREFRMIAEDDRNKKEILTPQEESGYGMDAVWADDFHHHVRRAMAGDDEGYFVDYTGSAEDLTKTLSKGWFFVGQLSRFANKNRGTEPDGLEPSHFVYCIQNHDQIGNRAQGERLNFDIAQDAYRAASGLLLLCPYTPLVFQGQEWAASTPFMYFTDHNAELGALVTKGRKEEFAHFSRFGKEEVPDPQALETFERSKLNWAEINDPDHAPTLNLYRDLLALRNQRLLRDCRMRQAFTTMVVDRDALAMRYDGPNDDQHLLVVVNLKGDLHLNLTDTDFLKMPEGLRWKPVLTTSDVRYGGPDTLDKVQPPEIYATGPIALVFDAIRES